MRVKIGPVCCAASSATWIRASERDGGAVKSYRVAYERHDSGWWVATVRGVRGCHTQGRTIDEARRRIREALELFVDNARKAQLWMM
jgi:predicted RNase H-like HicB family nuclease